MYLYSPNPPFYMVNFAEYKPLSVNEKNLILLIVKVGLAAVTAAVVWVIAAARGQDPTLAGPVGDSHRNKKRQFR